MFTLKYLLDLYHFSGEFRDAFRLFFSKVQERGKLPLGPCDCELAALASRKAYRRGLGTALVNRFTEHCRETGVKSIRLHTNTTANYGFYDKRGFRLVGERPYDVKRAHGKSLVYELLL